MFVVSSLSPPPCIWSFSAHRTMNVQNAEFLGVLLRSVCPVSESGDICKSKRYRCWLILSAFSRDILSFILTFLLLPGEWWGNESAAMVFWKPLRSHTYTGRLLWWPTLWSLWPAGVCSLWPSRSSGKCPSPTVPTCQTAAGVNCWSDERSHLAQWAYTQGEIHDVSRFHRSNSISYSVTLELEQATRLDPVTAARPLLPGLGLDGNTAAALAVTEVVLYCGYVLQQRGNEWRCSVLQLWHGATVLHCGSLCNTAKKRISWWWFSHR